MLTLIVWVKVVVQPVFPTILQLYVVVTLGVAIIEEPVVEPDIALPVEAVQA